MKLRMFERGGDWVISGGKRYQRNFAKVSQYSDKAPTRAFSLFLGWLSPVNHGLVSKDSVSHQSMINLVDKGPNVGSRLQIIVQTFAKFGWQVYWWVSVVSTVTLQWWCGWWHGDSVQCTPLHTGEGSLSSRLQHKQYQYLSDPVIQTLFIARYMMSYPSICCY